MRTASDDHSRGNLIMPNRIYFYCERDNPVHYFHFEQIDGTAALEESYALRFQVYCHECGFLQASAYPEGREIDDYDAKSSHFAGFYQDGDLAGTVRLVHGELEDLPLSEKCEVDVSALPKGAGSAKAGEISRLAVSKTFRRRSVDGVVPDTKSGAPAPSAAQIRQRRKYPELVLGLYKAMYHQSKRSGVEYWYAAMEKPLAKLLNRFHFRFKQIGPEIDYYGPVTPYVASLSDLETELHEHAPDLLWSFTEGLEPEFLPEILKQD